MLADSYAAADLNDIGVHILRSGLVHSLRMRLRAQEWIRRHPEIAEEVIVAPIVVVGMMRSGTTLLQRLLAADNRFHCAYGWEVVEVAPQARLRLVDAKRIRGSPSARSARRRRVSSPRSCSPSTRCTPASPKRRSSSCPTRSCRMCRSRVRMCRDTGLDRRTGLRAGVRVPAPDAAVPAVAEAAARSDREALGAQVPGTPWISGHACGTSSPICTWCTCTAIRGRRSRRAPASTRRCTRCTPIEVDRHRVGAQWLQRMGWTNDRAMASRDRLERRVRALHRHRVRRRGRRSDRAGGPRLRRDRPRR